MTTRIYYLPREYTTKNLLNTILMRIECSIGDIKINWHSNSIKVPITCQDKDVKNIERILNQYELLNELQAEETLWPEMYRYE